MPFCPKCRYEYVEGVERCPDCDVRLVPRLHDPEPTREEEQAEELVPCWQAENTIEADAACCLLREEGIPCMVQKSGGYDNAAPYLSLILGGSPQMTYLVIVPESKAAQARGVLDRAMPGG